MKNSFSSLSFSFNRNLSKLSPRFHACVVSVHWSPAFEHVSGSQLIVTFEQISSGKGRGWILINRKLIVPSFGFLCLQRGFYQREEGGWMPLVLSARPRHGRRQRNDSSHVELGWWVDGERGRKELKPWGLHCCSGGDYDWQANSFHSFSFFFSFSLPPPFFVPSSPSGSARSRCPQGPASCYHPGLASPL